MIFSQSISVLKNAVDFWHEVQWCQPTGRRFFVPTSSYDSNLRERRSPSSAPTRFAPAQQACAGGNALWYVNADVLHAINKNAPYIVPNLFVSSLLYTVKRVSEGRTTAEDFFNPRNGSLPDRLAKRDATASFRHPQRLPIIRVPYILHIHFWQWCSTAKCNNTRIHAYSRTYKHIKCLNTLSIINSINRPHRHLAGRLRIAATRYFARAIVCVEPGCINHKIKKNATRSRLLQERRPKWRYVRRSPVWRLVLFGMHSHMKRAQICLGEDLRIHTRHNNTKWKLNCALKPQLFGPHNFVWFLPQAVCEVLAWCYCLRFVNFIIKWSASQQASNGNGKKKHNSGERKPLKA